MKLLYNILFLLGFAVAAPYYFFRKRRRGNWRRGFAERFGKYDAKLKQSITNRQVIWLHAVSVGEVNICTQLIRSLEPRIPNVKIVVSTTTTTGMAELHKRLPTHISKIYYPVDHPRYVARAMAALKPEAIILVEAEIWPNFIWRANSLKIPLLLVNARLSEQSCRGYRHAGFLFRPLFASFAGVGAQNESDAAKLRALGCRPEVIRVVGSLKYDAAKLEEKRMLNVPRLLEQLGVPDGARILLGGSTHDGEEVILGQVYQRLKLRFPDLFLVLVPRHFERSRAVGQELAGLGLKYICRTEVNSRSSYPAGELDCLLVNTTGELKHFYEQGTVIFVGKSLTAQGGQNPIEPGALGKAMVFGPNMQNFAEIVTSFLARNAAIQVRNAAELESAVATLLERPERREQLGRQAREVVMENLGAVERTVDMIVQTLPHHEIYVTSRTH